MDKKPKTVGNKVGGKPGAKVGGKLGAKTGAKIGGKTGAKTGAKTGSKTGAKTGAKTEAKTAAKTGTKSKTGVTKTVGKKSKTGAKTGGKTGLKKGLKTIQKTQSAPLTLRTEDTQRDPTEELCQTDRVPEMLTEVSKPKELTTTFQDQIIISPNPNNSFFQKYMSTKGLLKESNFICESIVCEILSTIPKSKTVSVVLKTLDFQCIVKPISVILQREVIEDKIVDPVPQEVKNLETEFKKTSGIISKGNNKPILSSCSDCNIDIVPSSKPVFTQNIEIESINRNEEKLCYSKENIYDKRTFGKLVNNKSNLITHNYGLHAIEVIEELDLANKRYKSTVVVTKNFNVFGKISFDMLFEERRPQKVLGGVHFQEEDFCYKTPAPLIKLVKKGSFKVFEKPLTDYFFQKKSFSENSQQTEKSIQNANKTDSKPAKTLIPIVISEKNPCSSDSNLQKAARIISLGFTDPGMKKSEIENIKKEAKEREKTRIKRKNAAVRIQSWIRGIWTRKKLLPSILKTNKERLRQRKIKIIAKKIKKTWAPYSILFALKKWMSIKAKEKEDLYLKFQEYSAVCIQRYWKGWTTRKNYKKIIGLRAQARKKIRKLVRIWKIKRILATHRLQQTLKGIKDCIKLLNDLKNDSAAKLLSNQLVSQLPSLKTKFKSDILVLYRSGKWVGLPKFKPDESFSIIDQTPEKSFIKTGYNRDDMPIRTSTFNYEEEQDVILPPPEKQKTVNFLKKGGGKMSWKSSLEEKTAERLEKSYIQLQKSYISDNESPNDSKPKDFLKRKSKKIVPQKIKWKVEKKIDCWLSRDSAYYSKDSDVDIKPKSDILHLKELESIFLQMSGSHLSIHEFLDSRPIEKVPQLSSFSKFVIEFNEDTYQEMIEKLEGHYNNLCSDEVMSK